MLEWFFHLWWYYILSKPYEKYENMKIKKIHPLLCQKKLPPPLLSYSSHFWLMIETNKSARMFSCCRVRVLKSVSWTLTLESVPVNQLLLHACADSLLSMLGIAKIYNKRKPQNILTKRLNSASQKSHSVQISLLFLALLFLGFFV